MCTFRCMRSLPTSPEGEDGDLRADQSDPAAVVSPTTAVIFPYPYNLSGLPSTSSFLSRRESVSTIPASRASSRQLHTAVNSAPDPQPEVDEDVGGAPQAEVSHQEGVAASSPVKSRPFLEVRLCHHKLRMLLVRDCLNYQVPAMPAGSGERAQVRKLQVRGASSEGAEPSSKKRVIETIDLGGRSTSASFGSSSGSSSTRHGKSNAFPGRLRELGWKMAYA